MKDKKLVVQKDEVKQESVTCVCNMEWRGTHNEEGDDCVCYSEEGDTVKK